MGVTLTPNFHPQSTRETIYYNWDGVTPPAPDCPGIDVGGAVITTPDATLTWMPVSYWANGVVSPHLATDTADRRLEELLAFYRARRTEMRLRLGPSTSPAASARKSSNTKSGRARPKSGKRYAQPRRGSAR